MVCVKQLKDTAFIYGALLWLGSLSSSDEARGKEPADIQLRRFSFLHEGPERGLGGGGMPCSGLKAWEPLIASIGLIINNGSSCSALHVPG